MQDLKEFLKTIPNTQQYLENIKKFQYDNFINSEKRVKELAIQCDKIYGTNYSSNCQDNHSTNS